MTNETRRCRVCGCTDEDCTRCVERTGALCWWVADDLCSACWAAKLPIGTVVRVVPSALLDLPDPCGRVIGVDPLYPPCVLVELRQPAVVRATGERLPVIREDPDNLRIVREGDGDTGREIGEER